MTATMTDVSPATDEFAHRPDDTVETRYRHLDRHRRVRVGANITVVFEDRHTLWFRMHELNRVSRQAATGRVREQMDWYQRLMPGGGRLTAAVTVTTRGRPAEAARLRSAVTDGRLVLRSDAGHEVFGRYLPQQQSDRLIGLVRWAEFWIPAVAVAALHDSAVGWELAVEADGVSLPSVRLSESVLESLSADVG